jgi:hypothetical protein
MPAQDYWRAASIDEQDELPAQVAVLAESVGLGNVGERKRMGDRERQAT